MNTYNSTLYGSMDFKTWYRIGQQPGFEVGECPSFFPLPRRNSYAICQSTCSSFFLYSAPSLLKATENAGTTPGVTPIAEMEGNPTHVYKESHSWSDSMQVGTYTDGSPGHVGQWVPWPTQGPMRTNRSVGIGASPHAHGKHNNLLTCLVPGMKIIVSLHMMRDRSWCILCGQGHGGPCPRPACLLGLECLYCTGTRRVESASRTHLVSVFTRTGAPTSYLPPPRTPLLLSQSRSFCGTPVIRYGAEMCDVQAGIQYCSSWCIPHYPSWVYYGRSLPLRT
jgi:hypothetical protein